MKCLGRGLKKKIISNEEVWGSRSIICYLLPSALNTCKPNGILTANRRHFFMKKPGTVKEMSSETIKSIFLPS